MRALQRPALILFGALLAILPLAGTARAAEGIDLTTSPLPINITVKPGTTVTADIRVKNNSTNTQRIKVSLKKFTAYGDTGQPAIQDKTAGDDYFNWVSFSPSVLQAPTGQWQTTRMSIQVPRDAGFSYYYAVVFTPEGAKPAGKGNVLLGSSAVLVLLEVQNPHAKKQLQVASFNVDKHVFEFLPAGFSVKFHNSGNVHVIPHGDIMVSRGPKQLAVLTLNPGQGNVLPGTNRVFSVVWKDGFPVYADKTRGGQPIINSNGQAEQYLKWDFSKLSKLRFGRYTAKLTAVYDNGKQDVPIEATVGFWVIPWRILAGIAVVLVLIGLGLWSALGRPLAHRVKGRRK